MRVPCINVVAVAVSTSLLLLMTVAAAPVELDDEQSENALVTHGDSSDVDYSAPWDAVSAAALRKLLMQLDAEERLARVSRSWPQLEPRGWGLSGLEGRLPAFGRRQWRASKRETTARFRQCYFNPVSCFRK